MDNKSVYQENFKKEIKPGVSIEYIFQQVAEVHSSEAGWEIGTPHIEDENGNILQKSQVDVYKGKKYIVIPLTKYDIIHDYDDTRRR